MINNNIYIQTLEGIDRQINWTELNQLKKDILWVFSENTKQLNSSYVPKYSFTGKYWEYLSLDGDQWFYEEDRNFYKQGVLIIILCMTIAYIDTIGGNQKIFGETKLNTIIEHVHKFSGLNSDQQRLKEIVELGLDIANSMTETDLINTDEYQHNNLDKFYNETSWVDITFIKPYFQSLAR